MEQIKTSYGIVRKMSCFRNLHQSYKSQTPRLEKAFSSVRVLFIDTGEGNNEVSGTPVMKQESVSCGHSIGRQAYCFEEQAQIGQLSTHKKPSRLSSVCRDQTWENRWKMACRMRQRHQIASTPKVYGQGMPARSFVSRDLL